jgi:hypothetical protein
VCENGEGERCTSPNLLSPPLLLTTLSFLHPGHGGPHAADFVKKHLAANLLAHPKFGTDPVTALGEEMERELESAPSPT